MNCERCGCAYGESVAACPMCGQPADQPEQPTPVAEGGRENETETREAPQPDFMPPEPDRPAQPGIYAGFWIRFLAMLIDGAVLGLISMTLYGIRVTLFGAPLPGGDTVTSMFMPQAMTNFLVKAWYFIYFHAVTGQTVGKKALGIKVVGKTGENLGWARSAGRYAGSILSMLIFGFGYIWVAFDSRKQGWHDKMAGSYVVLKRNR